MLVVWLSQRGRRYLRDGKVVNVVPKIASSPALHRPGAVLEAVEGRRRELSDVDHSCLDHPERVLSHYWNGVNVAHAAHYFLATIRKGPLVQDGKFCTRGFVF